MSEGNRDPRGSHVPLLPRETPSFVAPPVPTAPENFSLRIVSLDHYMAAPLPDLDTYWSELEGGAIRKVPVVRIFGSTPAGQKACLHLHGAFPYFYVPYYDDLPQDPSNAVAYVRRLALALNAALSFSNAPPPGGDAAAAPGAAAYSRQRVYGATLVRGIPFYGYDPHERPWIKIMLYDPKDVRRAAALLLAGAVLSRTFQPHESHVPYLLQLKIDLNLQGMGYITFSKGLFRSPLPAERAAHRPGWAQRAVLEETEAGLGPSSFGAASSPDTPALSPSDSTAGLNKKVWVESTVPAVMKWPATSEDPPAKATTCELEFDGHVHDVLNRNFLIRTPLAEAGSDVRMVESLAPMWKEESTRCGGALPSPPPDPPRTPQLLSPVVDAFRDQFRAIETQVKACLGPVEAVQGEEEGLKSQQQQQQQHRLVTGTQAANEALFPSSSQVPSSAGADGGQQGTENADLRQVAADVAAASPAAAAGFRDEDYAQFYDENIIMTQMAMEAASGGGLGVEAGGADAAEPLPEHEDEEEDLLLALAMQLTSSQSGGPVDGHPSAADAGNTSGGLPRATQLSQPPINFPGSSSQAEIYRRAQTAFEQFLAETQRECDDILACSLPVEGAAEGDNVPEQAQHAQQEPRIPQIDGNFDDEPPCTKNNPSNELTDNRTAHPSHLQAQSHPHPSEIGTANADRSNLPIEAGRFQAEAAPSGPHEHQLQPESVPQSTHPRQPSSVIRVSREQVRVSSESLGALMSMMAPLDSDDDEMVERKDEAQQQDEMNAVVVNTNVPAGSAPPIPSPPHLDKANAESDLPPTQPILEEDLIEERIEDQRQQEEMMHGDVAMEEEEDAPQEEIGQQQQQQPEAPCPAMFPAGVDASWWREEVSQIPFEDLEWDLLDDEGGAGEIEQEEQEEEEIYQAGQDGGGGDSGAPELENELELGAVGADGLVQSTGQMFVGTYTKKPPTQGQLIASGWENGILPIVHPPPHYSDPEHVPKKPPIFAGKEFRVPCTAVQSLPAFGGAFERAKAAEGSGRFTATGTGAGTAANRIKLLTFTPARKPPSRAVMDAWLAAESDAARRRGRRGLQNNAAAGFVMDPNTGKLIPSGALQKSGSLPRGSQDRSASLPSQKSLRSAGDLLATPSLASLQGPAAAGGAKGGKERASQQRTPSVAVQRREQWAGAITGEGEINAAPQDGKSAVEEEEEEREEVRPASPKYDERSFFYSNPFVATEVVPSFRGGGTSGPSSSHRLSAGRGAPGGMTPNLGSNHPSQEGGGIGSGHKERITPVAAAEGVVAVTSAQQKKVSALKSVLKPSRVAEVSQGEADGTQGSRDGGKAKRVAFSQELEEKESPVDVEKLEKAAIAAVGGDIDISAAAAAAPAAKKQKTRSQFLSQITPPSGKSAGNGTATPSSQLGFKRIIAGKGQGLTLASIEVYADSRGQLLSDPRYDAVRAVVIVVADDDEEVPDGNYFARLFVFDGQLPTVAEEAAAAATAAAGAAAPAAPIEPAAEVPPPLPPLPGPTGDGLTGYQIERFPTELSLIDAMVSSIRSLDPDILMGFEVQKDSLGYLSDRAAAVYDRPHLLRELSRMPEESSPKDTQEDQYGWQHASGLHVAGRIVLNVWRIMRSELKLNIYTLENCVAAVLRLRIPHIPASQLTAWFRGGPSGGRWRCLSHLILRARLSLALLDRLDLVGRTAELARTFGIDFFSVLSRGSQYRVESMMLRLAHSQNYIALAPSQEQTARQPAMEALPLVMEPRSALYPDPVCVLDFQSLYPSMIIAYNLCFSTCIGRPTHAAAAAAAAQDGDLDSHKVKLGCSEYVTPLEALSGGKPGAEGLVITPNGVGFVPAAVRPGILPRLLNEILNTRIMVKGAMKRAPPSARVLLRCLNARQFGLKLIANVTYGYTAAGFSGRMPMAELADAIVQSGRATLEAAIKMVENNPNWRAKVVYGDTDSLFVQLPGRTVEEAFKIGAEIAAAVTAANPPPVTLKLEKVYRPCVLLSKKRYVGAMYESPGQKMPNFDAKGIETVRRDACPAVAKILGKSLRILFNSADLSLVREYLERQWTRILAGRVSISDFIFAKEVRLGTYSTKAGAIPPAALIATRAMATDPRAEPRYGERVPYVVVYGEPGARLSDMVVPPRSLVESAGKLRLHAVYYITKQINPALERALSLMGADVNAWFAEMPRPHRTLPQKRPHDSLPLGMSMDASSHLAAGGAGPSRAGGSGTGALTIERFYLSRHCAVCDELTHASKPLCERCVTEPQLAAAVLAARSNRLGRQYAHLVRVCGACGGGGGGNVGGDGGIVCVSLDCGVYYERRKVWYELQAAEALAEAGIGVLDVD